MEIKTERLILREFEDADAERLFLMDSNPEVVKYTGVLPVTELYESEHIIRMIRKQYIDYGTGRLAVVEQKSGLFIGWCGLKFCIEANGYKNFYDLGYRFLPEYWGKGYASEAAKASLEYGFRELNMDTVYADVHHENTASHHLMKKLGFIKTGELTEPDGLCFWYEKRRENQL